MLMMKFSGVEWNSLWFRFVCVWFRFMFCLVQFHAVQSAKSLFTKHIVLPLFHRRILFSCPVVVNFAPSVLRLTIVYTALYCSGAVHPAHSALAPFSFSHLFSNISVHPFGFFLFFCIHQIQIHEKVRCCEL